VRPGDVGLSHSNGLMGRAIRFGERIRWGERPSHWNHAFVVDRVEGDKVYVIQAEPSGVTNDKTIDTVGEYELITPPSNVNVDNMLTFARSQVGSRYGWLSILSIVFDIATPSWFWSVRRPHTWICSALVAESLRAGGWIVDWGDIYCVTPAQVKQSLSH